MRGWSSSPRFVIRRPSPAPSPATLGAVGSGARTQSRRRRRCIGLLVGHLRGRSQVIVLDNCEHVVAEAATVVEALLGEVPGLRGDRHQPRAARGVRRGAVPDRRARRRRRGRAVRRSRLGGAHLVHDRRRQQADRRRVVPPARSPAARLGAGGGPTPGAAAESTRRSARRSVPCAHRWEPHGVGTPPDAARRRRLEPRPVVRRRAAAVREARGVHRRLRSRGRRVGVRRRRARSGRRSSTC